MASLLEQHGRHGGGCPHCLPGTSAASKGHLVFPLEEGPHPEQVCRAPSFPHTATTGTALCPPPSGSSQLETPSTLVFLLSVWVSPSGVSNAVS